MKRMRFLTKDILVIDLAVVLISAALAFLVRLGFSLLMTSYIFQLAIFMLLALVTKPIMFKIIGLYRPYWGYGSWREVGLIILSSAVGSVGLIAAYLLVSHLLFSSLVAIPRSVFGIDWLLTLLGNGSVRWIARLTLGRKERKTSGLSAI